MAVTASPWRKQQYCLHACADTLVDVLTVEEMLLYTAELKRPLREGTASKKRAVGALIEDLNLSGCRATRIGNSMHRGISGGQVRTLTDDHTYQDRQGSYRQYGCISGQCTY